MNFKTIAFGAVALTVAAVAAGKAARPDFNVDELTEKIKDELPTPSPGSAGRPQVSVPSWGRTVDMAEGSDPDDAVAGEGRATSDETLNVIEGGDGNTASGSADETLNVVDMRDKGSTPRQDPDDTDDAIAPTNKSDPDDVNDDTGVSDSSPKGYGVETIEQSQSSSSWIENAKENSGANFL